MKIHSLQKLIRNDPDTKLSYDVNVEYGVNVNLFFSQVRNAERIFDKNKGNSNSLSNIVMSYLTDSSYLQTVEMQLKRTDKS